MSYQVIARRWRPQVFEEVVGQEAITRTLRNAIESGRLHHAYLFSGARGVGKTTTARLIAKALNCRLTAEPNPTPCNTASGNACDSCREIAESRSLDVLEFDAASHTKVDEIREIILESINVNPARDRFKVFIIDEVHMLSKSSFNALLKTLEEPPDNVVFVMATTELHKVPDTILSRCQQFEFRTIPQQKIFDRLKIIAEAEGVDITETALREIARSGEGSMRDAQSNFDQVISFAGESIGPEDVSKALGIASTENLARVMRSVADRTPDEMLNVVDDLIGRGQDLRNFCRDLMAFIRDLLVFKIAGDAEGLLDSAVLAPEEMKDRSAPFLEADLIRFFNSLADTEIRLRDAAEPRYVLEIGLVKLIEMRRVQPIEELIKRVAEMEERAASGREENSAGPQAEEASATATASEKKTLNDPVVAEPKKGEDNAQAKHESQTAPDVESSEPPPVNDSWNDPETEFSDATGDRAPTSLIDPGSMPVRLPPISSEELEHVEDSWLDGAYERALEKEGDDLSVISEAGTVLAELADGFERDASRNEKPERPVGDRRVSNKADEIISEMTRDEEPETELPELPADADEDALRNYAENHPAVKKAKRLLRAKVIKVSRD